MSETSATDDHSDERDGALARLEAALKEALDRIAAAESVIQDQRQRLKSLGQGREDTMRALGEVREELRRVTIERDELRKQLTRVDSVQTATIALTDDDSDRLSHAVIVPSLEDLMLALGNIEEPGAEPVAGHLHQRVQRARDSDESEEMLSPAIVFPEKFAANATPDGDGAAVSRMLVLLDPERPVKYPLNQEIMTIGRADSADIKIDNGFLSRLHARLVCSADGVTIEDYESKNGIRVNAKQVQKQALRHGDVVDLGRLRFRYIDTSADDAD